MIRKSSQRLRLFLHPDMDVFRGLANVGVPSQFLASMMEAPDRNSPVM
jgi:hypothetical protein